MSSSWSSQGYVGECPVHVMSPVRDGGVKALGARSFFSPCFGLDQVSGIALV